MTPDTPLFRLVRGLLRGETARRDGDCFRLADGRRAPASLVMPLLHAGAVSGDAVACRANGQTSGWLKRALLDADAFQDQHRVTAIAPTGAKLNLAESPLLRLAAGGDAFLAPHQVEAGERVRRLAERARLQPRLTMAYAAQPAGKRQPRPGDISDLAADARKALQDVHRVLPRDCAGVVLDVCGLLKGLQEIERERGWPRRSAKLVLRIGLDRLAEHYGLSPFAEGRVSGRSSAWMGADARPERFE